MASDLQKKSKPTGSAGKLPVTAPSPEHSGANPESVPFTSEQRQILGQVYQLILSWRRERLMKTTTPVTLAPAHALPAEREV